MIKISTAAALALMFGATAAFAGPGKGNTGGGNSGLAQSMAGAVSGGAATLGRDFGSKGKGTASAVSGGGNGGWGNVGSSLSSITGTDGQVSNRGGTRGANDLPDGE
ncbi:MULTISPECIES: hypothetical protein [unclassified Ruegeria]|uniref:hypothetical protein n=1 Tax=unclassified Ruegeria TaxID=2625375 RepID=UPI001ADA9D79|nr:MULTISPECIES: hypothetical protein [unclassified Ruegeria]MBO9411781.1 hypothetical protein [Ruegeria sp. R8_1]MBO9415658.1 hypothetical protein [Ruegeria sp. R8_2]